MSKVVLLQANVVKGAIRTGVTDVSDMINANGLQWKIGMSTDAHLQVV